MENALYDEFLMKRIVSFSTIVILLIVIGVVCIVYAFKNMRSEKSEFFTMIILCAAVVVVSLVLTGTIVVPTVCDIKDQSYSTYSGVFVLDASSYGRKSSEYKLLLDAEELRVDVKKSMARESNVAAPGNYTGMIVYAEKSKYVVAIQNATPIE